MIDLKKFQMKALVARLERQSEEERHVADAGLHRLARVRAARPALARHRPDEQRTTRETEGGPLQRHRQSKDEGERTHGAVRPALVGRAEEMEACLSEGRTRPRVPDLDRGRRLSQER